MPEASRLHTLFVGGDGRVHVDVGARRMTLRITIKTTSVELPPTSGRYLGQLLYVDMNELTGPTGLDATDHATRRGVEITHARNTVSLQDPVQRRGENTGLGREARRTGKALAA